MEDRNIGQLEDGVCSVAVINNKDWKAKMKKMQAMCTEKNPWKECSKTKSTMWVKDANLSFPRISQSMHPWTVRNLDHLLIRWEAL